MGASKSRLEITTRLILLVVFLVYSLIPTGAAYSLTPAETQGVVSGSRVIEKSPPVYYTPAQSFSGLQTGDGKDDPPPVIPPKEYIEFQAFAEISKLNDSLNITVTIRNNSETSLEGLIFRDVLEAGFEYRASTETPVTYDSQKREISLRIDTLAPGGEIGFSYLIGIGDAKNSQLRGKLSVRTLRLTDHAGLDLSTPVSIKPNSSSGLSRSTVPAAIRENQWNKLGRVNVYVGENITGQDEVVAYQPIERNNNGPEMQFKLDVYHANPLSQAGSEPTGEQVLSLQGENKDSFTAPAFLEINLDGNFDLKNIPAGQEPYVATYDEAHGIWVKVPILETDPAANTLTVSAMHFSTWGVGLGSSLPQNGVNVLLFDQPYTSLFTGASRYGVPIWTPQGRAGLSPDVTLSYSSATVDGVLGDVQAPWVGAGWNIDGIEIVRKITTSTTGYGYVNDFALTLNGVAYKLVQDNVHPNKYYTDHDAFLYIERHNYAFKNQGSGNANPPNTAGEWWEVATTDGMRYRLGWNQDAEQLALMYGYACTVNGINCLTPNGAYASLGYAGIGTNLVAMRWRVDRVTDTHGNYMQYAYHEVHPSGASTIAAFDRESYLDAISYTGYQNQNYPGSDLSPAYRVHFVYADRSSVGDIPANFNVWDNLDTQLLDKIEICYLECAGAGVVRTYDLGYSLAAAPNANGTLTLTSVKTTGGGFIENGQAIPAVTAPTIRFTYQNMDNRAVTAGAEKYTYPRLASIDNGTGGVLTYTYENDNRGTNSWYDYRVQRVRVDNGLGTAALQSYGYGTPVYEGSGGDANLGALIGYPTTTENQLNYAAGDAVLLSTRHTFGTSGLDTGRELKTEWLNGATIYRQVINTYVTDNSKAPFTGWNFRYLYSTVSQELSGGSLVQTAKNITTRDAGTGNLLALWEFVGNSLLRKTYYEYITNPDPKVYILDKVSRALLVNSLNQVLGDTRYHYDGLINTSPTTGDLTLTQRLTGQAGQTVDTAASYDIYGNTTSVQVFEGYGTANTAPGGSSYSTSAVYDPSLKTHAIQVTNALGQSSSTNYLYSFGLPYQSTDPNGWVSTTAYDGLSRLLSVNAPGLEQPGVYYTYPQVNASGRINVPYAVEMQVLDTPANQYRSVWGFYDGLGRTLQTQVFDTDTNQVITSDTYFNAQGLAYQQSLPYAATAGGGYYLSPSGTKFTQSTFDSLGRVLTVSQPGNITTTNSYDGLTTTTTDPNSNKTQRTTDGLGRLVIVKEYSDPATLYSGTYYAYDAGDRLVLMTNAKGKQSSIEYDWLGRKTSMQDPDMGQWSYTYSAPGNLTQQTDARSQALNFTYDALGRTLTKAGTDLNISYVYGGTPGNIGMRSSMTDSGGTTTWSYADFGRQVTENRQIGGQTKTMVTQTDWLGRPLSVTYPDGEELVYAYDALGRPKGLNSGQNNSLVELTYNVLGQMVTETMGNGIAVTNAYDGNTNRLASRTSTGNIINFGYGYDLAGNIISLVDGSLNETHQYTYDALNRLKTAKATTTGNITEVKYDQQFNYDQTGNITQMNDWVIPTPLAFRQDNSVLVPAVYRPSKLISFVGDLAAPMVQAGDTETPTALPTSSITITPTAIPIFSDGFESGDFSVWDGANVDGGDLSVSTQAASIGMYGMQAMIDDTTGLKVLDDSPNGEMHFSARFKLDPNSVTIPDNNQIEIFDALQRTFSVYLGKYNNSYTLAVWGIKDDGTWSEGAAVPILDEWQDVELEWQAASAAGANDGLLKLYVNDILVSQINNLDNDTKSINDVTLGVDDIPAAVSGTIYFDAFESGDGSHIGPVPTLTPTLTPTETPTNTATNTATFTPTETPTFTATNTATLTYTPSLTPTRTRIPTNTPVYVTATFTPTPSLTLTPATPYTSTPTPSRTPTASYTPTATPVPNLSLMAYWNFEAATATTAPDEASGDVTANNATLTNGPVIETTGANGKGIYFDGVNDYASVADQSEIKNNGSFTISAWINPSETVTSRTQYIVTKPGDYGLNTNTSTGQLSFNLGTSLTPNVLMGSLLPVNTWTLVTGVYDAAASQMLLYLNGELAAAQKVTGSVAMGTNPLTFSSSANPYHGRLDEVRFYRRALSTGEVAGLLNGFPTPTPNPTGTTAPIIATATATPTLLPMSAQQWGTGADGDLTIGVGVTYNINTQASNGRTCADAVAYAITSLGSTVATLSFPPPAGCLNPGDEVLIARLAGGTAFDYNSGSYEFLRVASVTDSQVAFTAPKTRWYGTEWRSDSDLGTGSGQVRAMLMRVPNYDDVTVNGTLNASAFDGTRYGMVAFRAAGVLNGSGMISANALGFSGGDGYGAGAHGASAWKYPGGGGGGGFSTAGSGGLSFADGGGAGGAGGGMYGTLYLDRLFMGSGGGYSGGVTNPPGGPGVPGAPGGGIVLIAGRTISYTGGLTSNGGSAETNIGGGGSGGSVRVEGETINASSINATGGSNNIGTAGFGGLGRIAFYYKTSLSVLSNTPQAYTAKLGQAPTPTPTSTPISFSPVSVWGTGKDGDLTVASGTFNLNTSMNPSRICADGASYSIKALTDSTAKLDRDAGTGCLAAGDEILILHLNGSGPNTGRYEFVKVGGVVGDVVYFLNPKTNFYGSSADSDAGVGTTQVVLLQRVPNYNNVTVNGTLTATLFDGAKYGVVVFRAAGVLQGSGNINTKALGFPGGQGYGAGGAGGRAWKVPGAGGGGGYGTAGSGGSGGSNGQGSPGSGGIIYGTLPLDRLYMGSGGGYSGSTTNPYGAPGSPGSPGGGIVLVIARTINYSGGMKATGGNPSPVYPYTGSGSGGSVRIEGETINASSITAPGGTGQAPGGFGRMAVYYYNSLTSNLTANSYTYLQQVNPNATATPTPTATPIVTVTPSPTAAPAGWQTRTYSYGTAHPHAVSSLTSGTSTLGLYAYDANGNMTCRAENGAIYKQVYNTENRIASIQKIAAGDCNSVTAIDTQWDFAYDGDGVRTATLTTHYENGIPLPVEFSAYYFGGAYELRSDGTTLKYYSFNGQIIAMHDGTGLQYFLTDHLGSVVASTDENGTLTSQQRYLPFGGTRINVSSPDMPATDFGYTGQRSLEGMGNLMDYRARFYSTYLSQFSQPDTIIPDPANPQAWNRYSYVGNRPINSTDPTGHKCVSEGPGDCLNDNGSPINGSSTLPVVNKTSSDGGGGPITFTPPPGSKPNLPTTPNSLLYSFLPSGETACKFMFYGSGTEDMLCGGGASNALGELNLWPDYYTFQGGVLWPPIIAPFGLAGAITYSNGHVFIAGGANFGKTFSFTALTGNPFSFNGSAGWIIVPQGRATPQQALNFQHGTAVNISVAPILGGGVNINSSGEAFEAGVYTPQAGISGLRTVLDIDLTTYTWHVFP